jgi:RHS repeat-associated protein
VAGNSQASFQVSRRFTGQVLDAETGLYYYNARYYDPELGRFIQPDTAIPDLSNPQSYNRYSYCVNNPLRYTDPSGHDPAFSSIGMFQSLSVEQEVSASRAGAPVGVGIMVATVTGGMAAPLLVSAGASTTFAAIGSGMIAGASGDLASQGTQIGLGTRSSISGQEMAVNSLIGGVLSGGASKIASLKVTPEPGPEGGPYSNLEDHPSVGPGKDFTQAQKRNILNANRAQNGGNLQSDESGTPAVAPQQSKKGITPPSNEAHVDHIEPKSKGGSNSYKNAQVLTREENMKKSDN